MSNNSVLEFTFPAEHEQFYKLFDTWRNENKDHVYSGGVYTLYADRPLNRVFGVDTKGILYIGKGDILSNNNRIGLLINALKGPASLHDAGVRYVKLDYKEKFPIEQLKVHIILAEDPARLEAEKLSEYEKQFGELPPLNRIEGKQP